MLVPSLAHVNEVVFRLFEALHYGLLWVPWETVLLYHEMVQIVPQVLGAGMTTMAVIDTEKGTLGPVLIFSVIWFDYVKNDGDSVLVVGSHKALVSVGSVCSHDAVSLETAFGGLMVGDDDPGAGLQGELLCFVLLVTIMDHLIHVLGGEDLGLGTSHWVKLLGHVKAALVGFKEGFETLLPVSEGLGYLV